MSIFGIQKDIPEKNLKIAQICQVQKMALNFHMPGKIQILIKRHVLFRIDFFWAKKWNKIFKI